jgi:hypothetical protein
MHTLIILMCHIFLVLKFIVAHFNGFNFGGRNVLVNLIAIMFGCSAILRTSSSYSVLHTSILGTSWIEFVTVVFPSPKFYLIITLSGIRLCGPLQFHATSSKLFLHFSSQKPCKKIMEQSNTQKYSYKQ